MVLPSSVISGLEKKLSSYKTDERFVDLRTYVEHQKDFALIKIQSTLDTNEVFKILGEVKAYTKLLELWKAPKNLLTPLI